jgi:hypothetical protein
MHRIDGPDPGLLGLGRALVTILNDQDTLVDVRHV